MTDPSKPDTVDHVEIIDPIADVDIVVDEAKPRKRWILPAILWAVGVAALAGMFLVDEKLIIGVFSLVLMLVFIALRFPVAIALLIPALLGLWAIKEFKTMTGAFLQLPFNSVANWSFSVVPMFIFIGLLMWRSGLTENLYRAGKHWLGWLPGGLAVGTNFAGAGLAAVSGSTIGTTYALTRIGVPEMLKAGYDKRVAMGSVIVAGLPGQLIPPSILLVIYAGIAEAPVGPQLLAGVGPGLLVALLFGITFALVGLLRPKLVGRGNALEPVTWGMRAKSLLGTWPLVILIPIIFVGMFSGVFTATEAGAVAALVSIVMVVLWRRKKSVFGDIGGAAMATIATTGAIMFMLIGASALSRMLSLSGVSTTLSDWITAMELGRVQFLLLMVVIYLVLGMFMEPLAMMLLTVPVLIPTLEALDISLLWFGVFVVLLGELAILTPPVGILAYIVHGIVQDKAVNLGQKITLRDVFASVGWTLPIAIIIILILIAFPQIVLAIPELATSVGD